MRRLGELPLTEIQQALKSYALRFQTGPFALALKADAPHLAEQLKCLYPHSRLLNNDQIIDFYLSLKRPLSLRRWYRKQIIFHADIESPFAPFPFDHALPLFEWGLNWCIAKTAHQYLMLHSAAVAKNDGALIMPAMPGSGKSTLCAALVSRGWRLLSDEFGLIKTQENALKVTPLPRPIPLKNQSIEIIRQFEPTAVLGPTFPKTRKGDVAHLRPPLDSQDNISAVAPRYFVFPKYQPNAKAKLTPVGTNTAFLRISGNSFNYPYLGENGFHAVAKLVQTCPAYLLEFSQLDQAVETLDELIAN